MKKIINILTSLLFTVTVVSCRKDEPVEQRCLGGCGKIDFNIIDYQPAWSPDGRYIAYYHIDSVMSKNGIYLITADGREKKQWHAGVGAETPTWSPDGKWIAFSMGAQIWKKKLNGDSLTQVTNAGRNFFPSWSPDGKWIAYDNTDCGSAVTTALINSCGILIFNDLGKKFTVRGRIPSWKDDNSFVYLGLYYNIYKYNLKDSTTVQLTNFSGKFHAIYNLKQSKKNKITLTAQNENILPQIWVMNDDGSSQKQLTQTGGYSSDWSPDGRRIVFTDSRTINGRLWTMDADGSNKKPLTF